MQMASMHVLQQQSPSLSFGWEFGDLNAKQPSAGLQNQAGFPLSHGKMSLKHYACNKPNSAPDVQDCEAKCGQDSS